jgi:hypothetical protein
VVLFALIVPIALLALMLGMEHIEQPLRELAAVDRLDGWLDEARPEEIEAYVRAELSQPIDRYWRRAEARRRSRLRRALSRTPSPSTPSTV